MVTEILVNVELDKSEVDSSIPTAAPTTKDASTHNAFKKSYFRTTLGILKIVQLVRSKF